MPDIREGNPTSFPAIEGSEQRLRRLYQMFVSHREAHQDVKIKLEPTQPCSCGARFIAKEEKEDLWIKKILLEFQTEL